MAQQQRRNDTRGNNRSGNNGRSSNPPVFRVGPIPTGKGESVSGCVWEREVESDKRKFVIHSVQVQSHYFSTKDDQWKDGSSFNVSQLSAVAYIIRQCEEYVFQQKDVGNRGDAHEGDNPNF